MSSRPMARWHPAAALWMSTYIYKVLMPERATLELVRTRDGTWMRGQLKRRGNKPIQRTTAAVVDQWLRERRTSSRGDVEAEF